jgi:hypothetical protein
MQRFHYYRDSLFLIGCTAYAINRWLVKPHVHKGFFHNYFDDCWLIPCALPLVHAVENHPRLSPLLSALLAAQLLVAPDTFAKRANASEHGVYFTKKEYVPEALLLFNSGGDQLLEPVSSSHREGQAAICDKVIAHDRTQVGRDINFPVGRCGNIKIAPVNAEIVTLLLQDGLVHSSPSALRHPAFES